MDDRFEEIPVAEWDRLCEALSEFCPDLTVEDDRLRCRAGAASFSVTREGAVDAGMPLHDLAGEATRIGVDAAGGELLVVGPELRYRFRRPG